MSLFLDAYRFCVILSPMTNAKQDSIFTRKPSVSWGQQLIGAGVGAALAWMLAPLGQKIGLYTTYASDQVLLWGAFGGAMLASLRGLVLAGAQITGQRGPRTFWLNLGVTLGLMLFLILLLLLLAWGLGALIRLIGL